MDELENRWPEHRSVGPDASMILGMLAHARQVPAPEAERDKGPAQTPTVVTTWGRWPW